MGCKMRNTPPALMHHRTTQGFTLIEISIVLVIIGLLAGGVLVGKDLMSSAGNRAYVIQLQQYNAAVNTFKLKYTCLPGDCATATDYGFTNNGNGNGMVTGAITEPSWSNADYSIVATDSTVTVYLGCCGGTEAQFFWTHLQSAGLISRGMKTLGVSDGVGTSYFLPSAKNDGTGIVAVGWAGKHYFQSGTTMARSSGNLIWSLNFSPADAAYIFLKMGGSTITTTNSYGSLYPDGLGKERVIVRNIFPVWGDYDIRFWRFQSQGVGGANNNVCIDTSVTPAYFNLQNPRKLCALIIQADF